MRYAFLTALAATAAVATPALAQTADSNFSGPRVGVITGYDAMRAGSTTDSGIKGDDQQVDGLLYGADLGYDFDLGNVVLGAEGEITGSTGTVNVNTTDPNYFGFGRVTTGRDLYVGGRVGFKATPKTLIYAKGGYTNARLNVVGADGATNYDEHFNLDGWRVGAGVEQSLGHNAYAKLEYRYSNYTDANFTFNDGTTGNDFNIDTDRHQVAAGVGLRF